MKKLLKTIGIILFIPYFCIAIFLTICLLNYNDYNVTELNGKSLVIIRDDNLEPEYKKNDLLVVEKNNIGDLKSGDEIFFYSKNKNEIVVNVGKIEEVKMITDDEGTIIVEGDYPITGKFFIGKADTADVYNNVGGVLSILESRWGYLFIVVFPILLIFIYEIYAFIIELKKPLEDE